ncbi:hypothetical protein B484DRAFT_85155 [Ochromonadaceae sp. CCMP2298]|nr:hypothetical protein B484DRAFT_85155 [Ochromonadaceae sp. CCMP2298]
MLESLDDSVSAYSHSSLSLGARAIQHPQPTPQPALSCRHLRGAAGACSTEPRGEVP